MNNKLYVGNLAWSITSQSLMDAFSAYGEVTDAFVMMDRATGRSKGFGFVTFADEASAAKAIEAMNGQDLEGRQINVAVARPPQKRDFE